MKTRSDFALVATRQQDILELGNTFTCVDPGGIFIENEKILGKKSHCAHSFLRKKSKEQKKKNPSSSTQVSVK